MTTLADALSFVHTTTEQSDLDRIFDACKDRRRTLGSLVAATVKIGDRVKIDRISPKYLGGTRGTVTSIERGKFATVEADAPVYGTRHRGTTTITGIPLVCLDLLTA